MLLQIILLSVISLIGFVLNIILFFKFLASPKKSKTSFQKLCFYKTIPNIIMTAIFAFWASTLSFFHKSYLDIPRLENLFISQIVGGFGYFLPPLIQICMAVNRFFIIYFPFSKTGSIPITSIAIVGSFLISNIPVLLSVLTNCYLVYDPDMLIFLPELLEECGSVMDHSAYATILVLAAISNGFNLAILVKLLKDEMSGISEAQKSKRRKRWKSMYIQSVIQDFIQLIDITNYHFTSTIFDFPFWTFLFCSLSFASVYAFDGLVMIFFHTNWNMCFGNKTNPKKLSMATSGVSSAPRQNMRNVNNSVIMS